MRRFRAPALAAASAALGGARKFGALGEDSRPPPGPHEGLMGEPKILERKKFEPKTPSSKDRRPQGRGSEPPAITTRHDEYIKGIKVGQEGGLKMACDILKLGCQRVRWGGGSN